jgi:hypothetical protein
MLKAVLVLVGSAFVLALHLAAPRPQKAVWSPFNCVRLQEVMPAPIPLSSPKREIIFVLCRDSYDPEWPEV